MIIIIAICTVVFVQSALNIYKIKKNDSNARNIYQKSEQIFYGTEIGDTNHESMDMIRKMYPDTAGWLNIPETKINYPVMKTTNYSYYLDHLPNGEYNRNGSLFLDYNNPTDFSGRLNIIYGHNMNSGQMFGTLSNYKLQSYYETHPSMILTTESENHTVDILYSVALTDGMWRERGFMYEKNLDDLLTYMGEHSLIDTPVTINETNKYLVLSTCSFDFDDGRFVIIGVIH